MTAKRLTKARRQPDAEWRKERHAFERHVKEQLALIRSTLDLILAAMKVDEEQHDELEREAMAAVPRQ